MRLDKFLSDSGLGSRRHVRKFCRHGFVKVDGIVIKDEAYKVEPSINKVTYLDEEVIYEEHFVILINKPKVYMSSNIDEAYPSILRILPEKYAKRAVLVGRLDVDTTGVYLITDDGKLANRIINPHFGFEKEYQARLARPLEEETKDEILLKGVDIDGDIVVPKKMEIIEPDLVNIIVCEGKYHEIKRIFKRYGNEVIDLKRTRLAYITCENLKEGEYRLFSEEEIDNLRKEVGLPSYEEEFN